MAGYQQPTNPAPVSGPGAMSQRTDGGPADRQPTMLAPGGNYGDRQAMADLQGSAPMSASPSAPPVPFTAPTQRPDEPVTSGAAAGEGPGPEVLGLGQSISNDTRKMKTMIPLLEQVANSDPDYKAMRMFVQYLKSV